MNILPSIMENHSPRLMLTARGVLARQNDTRWDKMMQGFSAVAESSCTGRNGGEVEFGKYSADIHNNKPCFCLAVNGWHASCRIRVGSSPVAGGQARQPLSIGVC